MTAPDPIDELITVRDWLRFAVSRFAAAGLVFGHGTASALDEAAFLVLHTLHLPHDQELASWLDARLTRDERAAVAAIIERRIETRKPAPYLTNVAYMHGHAFYVDERVIVPRSYIGELLADRLQGAGVVADRVTRVLDLCTGSGCLAILAALACPDAAVVGSDLSSDALAVAGRNVGDHGLAARITLVRSDLLAGLDGERFDLIIANPPYVTAQAVADFPPEYAAEPKSAHLGGADGMDLVRRILADAARHLTPDGVLVVEVGHGRAVLDEEFPALPFLWLDTSESEGEVFALTARDLGAAKPGCGKARR